MEMQAGQKRNAVGDLLSQLLSRDPVEFNSAINSNFASSVVYSGHGLKIKGASQLKHASWLFNVFASGKPASFELKDIHWNEAEHSATINTTRYVRPRLFPVFGYALPVKMKLRFNPDGQNKETLYVTSVEEYWPADTFVRSLPVVAWFYRTLFTPLATFVVLAISNVLFASYARASSSKRAYIDDSVDALSSRAKKSLPNDVSKNVNSGFQQGSNLAQGWGTSVVRRAGQVVYPVAYTAEYFTQVAVRTSNRLLPVSLPYPYIYDAHSGQTSKSHSSKKLPAPKGPAPTSAPSSAAAAAPTPASSAKQDTFISSTPLPTQPPVNDTKAPEVEPAAVEVGPSVDGTDQGKSVEIPSRANNETEDKPAAATSAAQTPLYDQLRKQDELPKAVDAEKLTAPSNGNHLGASSEEEEHTPTLGGNGKTDNGAPKKKKRSGGSKKKKDAHPHPPSFSQGLHHAEEVDAQVHEEHHHHHA